MTSSNNDLNSSLKQELEGYRLRQTISRKLEKYGSLIGIAIVAIVFSLLSPYFLTLQNFLDIFRQISPALIVACGLTVAIAGGGFDLSVGSQASLACVLSIYLLLLGWSPPLAIAVALAGGILLGAFNGFVCGTLGIVPWVGTLLTSFLAAGPQYILTLGGRVMYLPLEIAPGFVALGKGFTGPIPNSILVAVGIGLLSHLFMTKTKVGYHIVAMGSSKQASRLAGISRIKYIWLIYIVSGLLSAAGGILLAARLSGAQVRTADPLLTDAIAAVFIGSTILKEGEPHIWGTIIGVLFIGMMRTGITLLGVPYWGEYLFRGVIVFIAVFLSGIRSR